MEKVVVHNGSGDTITTTLTMKMLLECLACGPLFFFKSTVMPTLFQKMHRGCSRARKVFHNGGVLRQKLSIDTCEYVQ